MSVAHFIKSLLSEHMKNVFSKRSSILLSCNKNPFNHCLRYECISRQMHSLSRCRGVENHFRYHDLFNDINNKSHFELISRIYLCTIHPSKEFNQEDEKELRKGTLKQNSLRHDRILSVDLFHNFIEEKGDSEWTCDDWVQVGELLNSQMTGSWETMCMHTLMMDSNLDVGRSLMKFLEGQSKPPGPVITTFYIGLLGKTCLGDEEQELELKKYYDELVSVTEVFDAASIEVLVVGLSHTKFYKECVDLLETYKLTSPPGSQVLRNILMGALRNHDIELCSYILQHYESGAIEPSQLNQYAPAVIDIAIKSKNQDGLRKVFGFMQKHNLSLVKRQLETVVESFQSNDHDQWKGLFGFVNNQSGKCSVCGHRMPRLQLSVEDFKAIQSAFLDQVIVSDNIFFKTSPQEVQNFVKFVNNYGPFDVVIDGMNALHAENSKRHDKKTLERLVSYFCDSGKRILILGSKVLRLSIKGLERFNPKPAVYMTSTTRADDAFFLYAALHSGMNTVIVSSDKLRDHKFRLEPQLQHIFHRWLMSNQIYNFINFRSRAIEPRQHLFNLGPIKDKNGWHIPVNDTDLRFPFGRNGILCLRHGPENFVQVQDRAFRPKQFKNEKRKLSHDKEWFDW